MTNQQCKISLLIMYIFFLTGVTDKFRITDEQIIKRYYTFCSMTSIAFVNNL